MAGSCTLPAIVVRNPAIDILPITASDNPGDGVNPIALPLLGAALLGISTLRRQTS